MKLAIKKFEDAYAAMKQAESELNRFVEAKMKTCKNIDDFMDLTDELPTHYNGVRRVYEHINKHF